MSIKDYTYEIFPNLSVNCKADNDEEVAKCGDDNTDSHRDCYEDSEHHAKWSRPA